MVVDPRRFLDFFLFVGRHPGLLELAGTLLFFGVVCPPFADVVWGLE